MKFTTKLLMFWATVFLIFLLGIVFVMTVFWNIQFSFLQIFVVFILNGVIPPAIITSFFYKRLEYMESEDLSPPKFKGHKTAHFVYKPRTRRPFDELMQKIDRQYIISFSDRKSKTLKFRTDSRLLSWGICGYVKMNDNNDIYVVVYPIYENSRREALTLNQTLRILNSILTPQS